MAKKKKVNKISQTKKAPSFNDLPETTVIQLINNDEVNPYVTDLAKILGVTWLTMSRYLEAHPTVNKAMLDRRFIVRDRAEETINKILMDPDVDDKTKADLSKWVLKSVDERYKEKQDINIEGSIDINIKGLEDIDI